MSSILKSPSGAVYRIFLTPELDVGKHVAVLDLVLQRLGREKDETNLMDPTGKLHGYQPYIFAASDFSQGTQKSVFGELRTIPLDRLKMECIVKVKGVSVSPTSGYEFDNLALEITTKTSVKARSKK